jgi:hypothetical protein
MTGLGEIEIVYMSQNLMLKVEAVFILRFCEIEALVR